MPPPFDHKRAQLTREQAEQVRRATLSADAPTETQMAARIRSWNPETRTVDLILATETPVARVDWWTGDRWNEILSCAPGAMRTLRPDSGRMSVTMDHADERCANVIGLTVPASVRSEAIDGMAAQVVTAEITQKIDGDVEFNRAIEQFERGLLPNLSCRYQVYSWMIQKRDGMPDECTATDWEILSVSPVATPADPNAYSRSAGGHANFSQENPMPQVAEITAETVPVDPAIKARAWENERKVIAVDRAQALGLPVEDVLTATVGATDAVDVTERLLSHLGKKSKSDGARNIGAVGIEIGTSAKENTLKNLEAAFCLRGAFQRGEDLDQYKNKNQVASIEQLRSRAGAKWQQDPIDSLRAELVRDGQTHAHDATRSELSRALLGFREGAYQCARGTITNSDLTNLTANLATKTLVPMLKEQFFPVEQYCLSKKVKDYKLQYPTTFDGVMDLPAMAEAQDYEEITLSDSAESYRVKKYGLMVKLSDQLIANDDLGALREAPVKMMQAGYRTRVKAFFSFLLANAALSDGNALFSANHANIVTPYVALSTVAALDAAAVVLAAQMGKQGEQLELEPWGVIVGRDGLTAAQQATGTFYNPTTAATAIPEWAGKVGVKGSNYLSEAYLVAAGSSATWYLWADPNVLPLIVMATLESSIQNGMMLKSRQNFKNDSFEITLADAFGFGVANSSGNGAVCVRT